MRPKTKHPRSPGRPVANPHRDVRELLLTAATELFAQQGVAGTTFATIARRAGLTPAMLHYYFKDRDELLDCVVEERLCPLLAHVWGPVEAGGDAAEIIRGLVHRLLEATARSPWVPPVWVREILNDGGLLRGRILPRLPYEKLRIVSEAIAKGQAAEELNPDIDPVLVIFSTLGLVMLHMATIKVWGEIFKREPLGTEEMRRHITGLLLNGLCHTGYEVPGKSMGKRKR